MEFLLALAVFMAAPVTFVVLFLVFLFKYRNVKYKRTIQTNDPTGTVSSDLENSMIREKLNVFAILAPSSVVFFSVLFALFYHGLLDYVIMIFFFTVPTVSVILFLLYLIRYIHVKKKNRQIPGTYSDAKVSAIKEALIVFTTLASVFVGVVIGAILLLYAAAAYM